LYWAGVRESPALRALASSLRRALKEAGYPVDDKPFRPHITLARQARFASPPRIEPPALSMTADQIILMESKRIDGRLVYVPRFRKTLLGA